MNPPEKRNVSFADYMTKCEEVLEGKRTLESLAVRECGDCNLCCIAPGIEAAQIEPHELDRLSKKPAGKACGHCTNAGCKIYENRPKICASYQCLWLAGLAESKPSSGGVCWCLQPCMMTMSVIVVGHALDAGEVMKDVDVRKDIRSFLDFTLPVGGQSMNFAAVVIRTPNEVVRFDNTGDFPHLMADVNQADPMKMDVIGESQRRAIWKP